MKILDSGGHEYKKKDAIATHSLNQVVLVVDSCSKSRTSKGKYPCRQGERPHDEWIEECGVL